MAYDYDLILHGGTIYDGGGVAPFTGDVAVVGQKIAAVGRLDGASARQVVDVSGLAVAPGFINIMSWAPITLIIDGKSQSDIRQGITLEVFGEGWSEGPLTDEMRLEVLAQQGDLKYEVPWTSLGDYLEYLEKRGVSTNFASFVGADTVRIYALDHENRAPTKTELDLMKRLVRQSMEEGAMGMSTALIYAPGCYASTEEIIELAKVVSEYDGIYISHLRSEGNSFLEGVDELLRIAREANIRSEIYHLKAMGEKNWPKMEAVLQKVEEARAQGLRITADMYTYTAGATGLGATMPRWVEEGGHNAWVNRLKDPAIRERLRVEMTTPTDAWENVYLMAKGGENIILSELKTPQLKPLIGKTLAEAARARGKSEIDTIFDLIVEDNSGVGIVYFIMSEENIRKQLQRSWVCLGSDSPSQAPEGIFLKSGAHPRAYGTFARFLGKYVRDEQVVPLEEAVRKITSLPANTLKVADRGWLKPGYFADIAVFDPARVQDHATYAQPQQYASGMVHVFVNGQQVLQDGEHTGATPGQIVRGPGWKRKPQNSR
ncbi:MAG: D-aminoacylase [Chloroflexi bacterium]|nr:D-aminoacylase [Chloroflexota bacterium]